MISYNYTKATNKCHFRLIFKFSSKIDIPYIKILLEIIGLSRFLSDHSRFVGGEREKNFNNEHANSVRSTYTSLARSPLYSLIVLIKPTQ